MRVCLCRVGLLLVVFAAVVGCGGVGGAPKDAGAADAPAIDAPGEARACVLGASNINECTL